MLVLENTAALLAFIICVGAFVMGYAMHNAVDDIRAELATTYTYRPRNHRRASHGGR